MFQKQVLTLDQYCIPKYYHKDIHNVNIASCANNLLANFLVNISLFKTAVENKDF